MFEPFKSSIGFALQPRVLTIAWRDLRSMFYNPVALIVLLVFVVINGCGFWLMIDEHAAGQVASIPPFFRLFFTISDTLFLVIIPPLTMKVFAEEKRLGTIESLMTAPVTETAVVLGKFLAVLGFFIFLWLTTLPYAFMLSHYMTIFDWGPALTWYFGVTLMGMMLIALGVFTSSLTRDQLIAYILTMIAITMSMLVPVILEQKMFGEIGVAQRFAEYIAFPGHLQPAVLGLVSARTVVFFGSLTVLLLFLSVKVIESRKWRSSGSFALTETKLQRVTKFLGMVGTLALVVAAVWALILTIPEGMQAQRFWSALWKQIVWVPVTGLALIVLCFVTNMKFFRSLFFAGRSWYFINVAAQVMLMLAAVVLANLIAARTDVKWDFTTQNLFSVSDQTRQRVESVKLDSPLEMTLLWFEGQRDPQGDLQRRLIKGLMGQYVGLSPWIAVDEIKPDLMPNRFTDFAARAHLSIPGGNVRCVALTYKGKTRVLNADEFFVPSARNPRAMNFSGEQTLTGGILQLTTRRPTVCFVADAGCKVPQGATSETPAVLTSLKRLLQNENFTVIDASIKDEGVPPGTDLVVLYHHVTGPDDRVRPRTVPGSVQQNIRRFLQGNDGRSVGALIVIGWTVTDPGLDGLLDDFGLQVFRTPIFPSTTQPDGTRRFNNRADDIVDGVLAASHPVTELSAAADQRVMLLLPQYVTITRRVEGMQTQPMVLTDPQRSLILNNPADTGPFRAQKVHLLPEGFAAGPFNVMVSAAGRLPGAGSDCRLVVLADGSMMEPLLRNDANRALTSNTFNWLAWRDQLIAGIAPREMSIIELNLTEAQRSHLRLTVIAVMPSVVLLLGGLGWWIRRR